MPRLILKDLPRYECLLEASERYPSLDASAAMAFLHLLRAGDDVFKAENGFFARHKITQGRFTVLMLLNRPASEPRTPATLAEQAGVTRATMTGLIDSLENNRFVKRTGAPHDRRAVQVRLTDTGRRFLDRLLPHYFSFVSTLIQPLSEAQRKQLVQLLRRVEAAAKAVMPEGRRSTKSSLC
jgi:DNA-binding MarR family transcriptional regulator